MSEPVVLGIESTCDETAAAIVRGRELLSNVVRYAYDDGARHRIDLKLETDAPFHLTIADDGKPFDPKVVEHVRATSLAAGNEHDPDTGWSTVPVKLQQRIELQRLARRDFH